MPENNEMSRVSNKKNQKKNGNRKNNQKKNRKKNKSNKSWFKRILIAIVALVIIALLSGVGLFTYYASSAPELTMEDLEDTPSTTFYDSDGDEIYSPGQEREPVEAGEIPQVLVDACLK